MQKALGLTSPPSTQAAERRISIEGTDYLVRMLELPVDEVDIDNDDLTVSWPETIEDKVMPKIDGALTLYDVKDQGSLESIPEMLSECHLPLSYEHDRRCNLAIHSRASNFVNAQTDSIFI